MIEVQLLTEVFHAGEERQLRLRVELGGDFSSNLELEVEATEVLSLAEQLEGFPTSVEQTVSARLSGRHTSRYVDLAFSCADRLGHVLLVVTLGSADFVGENDKIVWNTVTCNVSSVAAEIDTFQGALAAIVKGTGSRARLA